MKALFWAAEFFTASSHGGRDEGALPAVFSKGTNPTLEDTALLTLSPPNTITLRVKFLIGIWGDTNIQIIANMIPHYVYENVPGVFVIELGNALLAGIPFI